MNREVCCSLLKGVCWFEFHYLWDTLCQKSGDLNIAYRITTHYQYCKENQSLKEQHMQQLTSCDSAEAIIRIITTDKYYYILPLDVKLKAVTNLPVTVFKIQLEQIIPVTIQRSQYWAGLLWIQQQLVALGSPTLDYQQVALGSPTLDQQQVALGHKFSIRVRLGSS